MKINIKEVVHKINESVPEKFRNIVWTIVIIVILLIANIIIQTVN